MQTYTEFTVSDVNYRCRTMDAVKQLNVYRRLTPLLDAVRVITRGRKAGDTATPVPQAQVQEALSTAMVALGGMPDEQVNYVLAACLALTDRQDGAVWAPLWNASANRVMYDDVKLVPLIMICFNVLKASIGPFSLDFLPSYREQPPQA